MNQKPSPTWWTYVLQAMGHVTGVAVILCVFALLYVDENVFAAIEIGVYHKSFYDLVKVPILLQVGLASCIWAFIVIAFHWVRLSLREQKSQTHVLKRARGTILTETLIVLPVFLLLTSGLAQLSINSNASILMGVATFQAARTSWLWEPETRAANARNNMAGATGAVNEKARIAAATVLTPVVPAEFRGTCNFSNDLDQRMRAFGAAGAYAGAGGAQAVRGLTTPQDNGLGVNTTYWMAYDTSTFAERGAKKFFIAYCLTRASMSMNGELVRTTVNYDHMNVFPWFGYIFGRRKVAAGNLGYYMEMEGTSEIQRQIDANPREPWSFGAYFNDIRSAIRFWE